MPEFEARLKYRKKESGAGSGTAVSAEKSTLDATERESLTSGLSSGKAAKGGGDDMPKPQAGETALSPAHMERVRKWREGKRAANMNNAGEALARRLSK